jgi:hypothetical protein
VTHNGTVHAVTTSIVAGSPTPADGCMTPDWLAANGAVPTFSEIYVQVMSPRSECRARRG